MGQARPQAQSPGTAGSPASRSSATQVPSWSVFSASCTDVPVSLHKQQGVTSRILLSHAARKAAQPRQVHVELRPPGSSVSLGLSMSPLWLSVCPSSAVHRAKREREEVRIGPQRPSARWHPGWQSLAGPLERGTRHSERPPHPPPAPGGVDLSPDGVGSETDGARSPARPQEAWHVPVAWSCPAWPRGQGWTSSERPLAPTPPKGGGPLTRTRRRRPAKVRLPTLGDAQHFPRKRRGIHSDHGDHQGRCPGNQPRLPPAPPRWPPAAAWCQL